MSRQSPITPSVGRIVLVRGPATGGGETAAIVTRVWSDNCINVHVFRDAVDSTPMSSVEYDDSETAVPYAYWRWMPYQVAKAAEEPAKSPPTQVDPVVEPEQPATPQADAAAADAAQPGAAGSAEGRPVPTLAPVEGAAQ